MYQGEQETRNLSLGCILGEPVSDLGKLLILLAFRGQDWTLGTISQYDSSVTVTSLALMIQKLLFTQHIFYNFLHFMRKFLSAKVMGIYSSFSPYEMLEHTSVSFHFLEERRCRIHEISLLIIINSDNIEMSNQNACTHMNTLTNTHTHTHTTGGNEVVGVFLYLSNP